MFKPRRQVSLQDNVQASWVEGFHGNGRHGSVVCVQVQNGENKEEGPDYSAKKDFTISVNVWRRSVVLLMTVDSWDDLKVKAGVFSDWLQRHFGLGTKTL